MEPILEFFDGMKMIAITGGISDEILVAMALNALPDDIADIMIMFGYGECLS